MHLQKIEIKEREELEPMLVADPSLLEDGMKIVAHQLTSSPHPQVHLTFLQSMKTAPLSW